MFLHRLLKKQISLRHNAKGFAFFLVTLLLSGCADESINNPVAEKPVEDSKTDDIVPISANYFPMTVGSRWVYRNNDGSEWTREVTESEDVGSRSYYSFIYNPPIEDNQFVFFRAPSYIVTLDSVVLKVNISDINDAIWDTILQSNDNLPGWTWVQKFQNGEWQTRKEGLAFLHNYKASGVLRSDSGYLFRLPLVPGQTWEMLNVRLSGSSEMAFMRHSFEADVEILGIVGDRHSVPTPAGFFEDCLNIRYEAKPPSVRTKEFADGAEAPEFVKEKRRKHLEAEIRNELTTLLTHLMPNIGVGIGVVSAGGWTGENRER